MSENEQPEVKAKFTAPGVRQPTDPETCRPGDNVLYVNYDPEEEPPFLSGMIVEVAENKGDTVVIRYQQYEKEVSKSSLSTLEKAERETETMNGERKRIALLTRARIFMALHENDKGETEFNRLMEINAHDAEAHFLHAQLHMNRGNLMNALGSCNIAVVCQPNHTRALAVRAMLQSATGNFEAAEDDLEQVIRLDPNYGYAYEALAMVNLTQGKVDQAALAAEHTLKINPRSAKAHVILGNAYAMQGDFATAADSFSQALNISPVEASAYSGRSVARLHLEEHEEALQDALAAEQLQPESSKHRYHKGMAYEGLGRLKDAEKAVSEAVTIAKEQNNDIERAAYLVARGELEMRMAEAPTMEHEIYMAITDFAEAIRTDPGNLMAYVRRADAFLIIDDDEKAQKDVSTVLNAAPHSVDALHRQAVIHMRAGDHEKSLKVLEEALAIQPYVDGFVLQALMYENQYKLALAVDSIAKALELDPWNQRLLSIHEKLERQIAD